MLLPPPSPTLSLLPPTSLKRPSLLSCVSSSFMLVVPILTRPLIQWGVDLTTGAIVPQWINTDSCMFCLKCMFLSQLISLSASQTRDFHYLRCQRSQCHCPHRGSHILHQHLRSKRTNRMSFLCFKASHHSNTSFRRPLPSNPPKWSMARSPFFPVTLYPTFSDLLAISSL